MRFKIIVDSEEMKEQLIAESEYIHWEIEEIDSDRAGYLMHIYANPSIIEVDPNYDFELDPDCEV
jgi:hypothetical protein